MDNLNLYSNLLLENAKFVFISLIPAIWVYTNFLVKWLACMDNDLPLAPLQELERQIGITNTSSWIVTSWKKLSAYTIKNCFFKAGFVGRSRKDRNFMEEDNIFVAKIWYIQRLETVCNDRWWSFNRSSELYYKNSSYQYNCGKDGQEHENI